MDASKSTSKSSQLDDLATSVELARKIYSEIGSCVEQETQGTKMVTPPHLQWSWLTFSVSSDLFRETFH